MSVSRKLAAELIGTLILVATVVGSGIMGQQLSGGNDAIALLGNTLATGCILAIIILIFGPVSGAHFNPAVTLAFYLRGQIDKGLAAIYVVFQIIGGLLGTVLAHHMFELTLLQQSSNARTGLSQWSSEVVATFGLVLTIFACLRHRAEVIPFAVGLYISAGYWFTSSTSFANPAVTIARGFTDTFSGIHPNHIAGFIVAQLVGAIIATLFYRWQFQDR